jgi:hypothetical protein
MPAWNKGQITGQKLPLKPREVWGMIRARLEAASNSREHEHTEPSTQPMKHREISGEDAPAGSEFVVNHPARRTLCIQFGCQNECRGGAVGHR